MPPIVSFIGWHNSGKTTLASQVVNHLSRRRYRVAVVKSTKDTGILMDRPGSDTSIYREAGANAVSLVAPDTTFLQGKNSGLRLTTFVHRYFADMDLVIAEGFKHEHMVPKIEVTRGDSPLLRGEVTGVIALATDRQLSGDYVFRLDESLELADFIEKRFLEKTAPAAQNHLTLLVDGKKVALKPWVQKALGAMVSEFVASLKNCEHPGEIEIRIHQ
ncbi:MAG: molybdopterin-guanine dinucleotide biosynthesis protein B [Desulfobulbus propionicus]|nr:MAG: molybdopterin-guanine dinucleotide biosynthesis protein B [Desulfobulbus propionicus]